MGKQIGSEIRKMYQAFTSESGRGSRRHNTPEDLLHGGNHGGTSRNEKENVFGVMQTMLRNYRDEGDYAITTFKACVSTPGSCLACKMTAKMAAVGEEQLMMTSMNKNYDRLFKQCDRQFERLGIKR